MNTLILAAVLGIALIVVLIAVVKLHPFLSLLIGAAATAMIAGVPYNESLNSFTTGVGGTVSSVGLLIALGGIIGILLTRSGGADVIVDTILKSAPQNKLAWAMAFSAFIVGYPALLRSGRGYSYSNCSARCSPREDARYCFGYSSSRRSVCAARFRAASSWPARRD